MQSVHNRYYFWYNAAATFIGLVCIAGSLAAHFLPGAGSLNAFGFTVVTGAIGLLQVMYGLLFYQREARAGVWLASLFSFMILTLNIINLIHNNGQLHSPFLILWALHILTSGMFGLYAVVTTSFIITMYFVLIATGEAGRQQLDVLTVSAVFGSYVVGIISYVSWKRLYVDQESRKVQQLTGQLQTKQQQAEILIQSITDGMIVITVDSKISLMNPAAAKMTQWDVGEATGLDASLVLKFLKEDGKEIPPAEYPLQKVFRESKSVDGTFQLVGREGKAIYVSAALSPVVIPKSTTITGAVAVLRDISTTRAEEQRRADFISTASHEMRTPVAAIEGYLALALNDKVSSIDSKARNFLEKAHSSTQHLGKLFQDLLTSARAEDGRLVNHPVVVEMGSYIEQLTDSLRFAAEKKGLLMDLVIGSDQANNRGSKVIKPLYYTHVDPDRIREVITNLFDNAVKYTETGKISIGLTGNSEVVQLYIRDTGPGIPPDDIPHLFQKFYRVDNSATRTIGGTGLGLFICRKIVELYSGRIWVESVLGKGSSFYINLPRLSPEKALELQKTEASEASPLSPPSA
jgi:PAS domain S-box-containing protein